MPFCFRGIGAVVYKVPELNNDQMLKISLRSLEQEDTTCISQVHLFPDDEVYKAVFTSSNKKTLYRCVDALYCLLVGIWWWGTS